MYTAQDALDDLQSISFVNYWTEQDSEAVNRLYRYLTDQRYREYIPELLRTKHVQN